MTSTLTETARADTKHLSKTPLSLNAQDDTVKSCQPFAVQGMTVTKCGLFLREY